MAEKKDTEKEEPKKDEFAEEVLNKASKSEEEKEEEAFINDKVKEGQNAGDILDDVINKHYDNIEDHPEDEDDEDNDDSYEQLDDEEEEEFHFEDEEEPRKGKAKFEGIRVADIVSAEMAITYYEDLVVKICQFIAKFIIKHPRKIDDDEIRVSDDIRGISAQLLDVYWQTIRVKINPVLGAAILMTCANISNFMDALQREEEMNQGKDEPEPDNNPPPSSENKSNDSNTIDVDYVEVKEEPTEVDEEKTSEFDKEIEEINKQITQDLKNENLNNVDNE